MLKITLKDGSIREYDNTTTPLQVANDISEGFARQCVACEINGELSDLTKVIDKDCELNLLKFSDEGGKWTYRHTTSHVMAQAVKELYPNAKLAIGPAIKTGFYYDFDIDGTFSDSDLVKIEEKMNSIIKADLPLERFELPKNEAIELMKDEPYKVELINDFEDDVIISFYKQGDFVDLCAGAHLASTGKIKAFKLLQTAGAYWKGSEKNKMLQRIYGTAFDNKKELKKYIFALEEAKKRDHNKLGRELGYFTTVECIGQGLPLLMPKGAKTIQILQRFVEDEEAKRGYELTKTPFMAKSDLYKMSGHWDHYKDGMFVLGDEEKDSEVLALRPMTCPFQFFIYKTKLRSYRDLPVRYNETATLFRNESSGEMHGLTRVRQFTLSEGHIMVTPDQLASELGGVVDLINYCMNALGISEDVTYRFSKWDPNNKEKYVGDPKDWESSQALMKTVLDDLEIDYVEAEGEAAFYGPKLDIQTKNVYGKEDTLITVQVDFPLAERFDMTYVDSNGDKKHPFIIHRTSIGCYERTLAFLLEKYAGALPVWLAPIQARILTIASVHDDYAYEVKKKLEAEGIRVEIDVRNEKIGYKIREARNERLPYILVVGDKELEANAVAVRSKKEGELGAVELNEFIAKIVNEDKNRIV